MNRTTRIRLCVTTLSKLYGSRACMSSLVEVGAPGQYSLPLMLLPTRTLPLRCDTFGYTRKLPSLYYSEQITMSPTAVSHVNVNRELVWPMPIPYSQPDLPSIHLQNGINEQNTESPKPEKPKWEEEQYPDIGKSTSQITHQTHNISHRYFIKSSSIPIDPTSSKVNPILQDRTPLIPHNTPILPNSPTPKSSLPHLLPHRPVVRTCLPKP